MTFCSSLLSFLSPASQKSGPKKDHLRHLSLTQYHITLHFQELIQTHCQFLQFQDFNQPYRQAFPLPSSPIAHGTCCKLSHALKTSKSSVGCRRLFSHVVLIISTPNPSIIFNFFHTSRNAALMKVVRIWRSQHQHIDEKMSVILRGMLSSFTRVTKDRIRRVNINARPGRGRKRAVWTAALYTDLLLAFDRLRRLGVKMNMRTLKILARYLTRKSVKYSYKSIDTNLFYHTPIIENISISGIQSILWAFPDCNSRAHWKAVYLYGEDGIDEKRCCFFMGKRLDS